MHIRLILKKVTENIYVRKMNFLLVLCVMTITFYLSFSTVAMLYETNYSIYETQQFFSDNSFVNVCPIVTDMETDTMTDIANFVFELQQRYGENVVYFEYQSAVLNQNARSSEQNVLYIRGMGEKLGCQLTLTDEISAEGYRKSYVCESMLDEYPVGTIFYDEYMQSESKVVGYFSKGSKWISEVVLFDSQNVVALDDYIVSEFDEEIFDEEYGELEFANLSNSIYVLPDSEDETDRVRTVIKELADENNVMYYDYTLDELVSEKQDDLKEAVHAVGILNLFVIAVSLAAVFTSCMADVFSRRKDIAIMSIIGVSPIDLFVINFTENIFKLLIAFGVAVGIYGSSLETERDYVVLFKLTLPTVLVAGLICILVVTVLSQIMVRQKNLLDIVGGARL